MYSIRCCNSRRGEEHFFRPVSATLLSEIDFLRQRFSNLLEEQNEFCHIIEPTTTRRTQCGKLLLIYS